MPPFKRYEPQIPEVLRLLGVNEPPKAPKRSKLTFKEIAERAQVSQSCVTFYAALNQISPPSQAGIHRPGRPKGTGKKLEPRSPHREPAFAMFSLDKTPPEVAKELGISDKYAYRFYRQWLEALELQERGESEQNQSASTDGGTEKSQS